MSENNKNLEFYESEKISLRELFNEKWLQDKIEEDPTILGLGELEILKRERKQSSGGKIDFLLKSEEDNTLYEVEIQLGKTDESHIIRTIEYWDLERRKNPSYQHRAVIVAEDITSRFFNVIYLMNRSIPIIAIQVNALKVENKIILNFTKVLDVYEHPEDEIKDIGESNVDRPYWTKRASPKSLEVMDKFIQIAKSYNNELKITYNKFHIALGTSRRNFVWFHPRKASDHNYIDILVSDENVDKTKNNLEEMGISPGLRKRSGGLNNIKFPLKLTNIEHHKELLAQIINDAIKVSS
ncbi:unnamed protein product [marine sediment metagenome]|uniref:DUF5655 domain-containing protein n=1 Tax=marine sediment metagenome TaxID=412755 RepID=X0YN45_9ZZZZ